jgi:hypothetical protein
MRGDVALKVGGVDPDGATHPDDRQTMLCNQPAHSSLAQVHEESRIVDGEELHRRLRLFRRHHGFPFADVEKGFHERIAGRANARARPACHWL